MRSTTYPDSHQIVIGSQHAATRWAGTLGHVHVTFPVGPVLDAAHAAHLEACVSDPALSGSTLCVDLGEVETVTTDGVAGLSRCRFIASQVGVRLSYRTTTRAGRHALLAAWRQGEV